MIFPQLFCKHKWSVMVEKQKSNRIFVQNIIGDGYNPTDVIKETTIRIMCCDKCGKIKTLKY